MSDINNDILSAADGSAAVAEKKEMLPVVDSDGRVIGSATRAECHGGSMLLHPVVHLHVIDGSGHMLLQLRSLDKVIQPGRWDTAVGGHVDYGEDTTDALLRETREELGLTGVSPVHMLSYLYESEREREMVHVYYAIVDPLDVKFAPDPAEVTRIAWWSYDELAAAVDSGMLTPNFVEEFARIRPMLDAGTVTEP